MKTITSRLLAVLTLLCCTLPARADHLTAKFLFAARLDGAQEAPAPIATSALGVTSFFLSEHRDTLCITGTFNGLSGPITGIHIHEAPPGVAGPVVVDLMPYITNNGLSVSLSGTALAALNMGKLFGGQYYINVHTAANPSGEIRGQILLEEDKGFIVQMDGAQETPPATTTGRGLGSVILSRHTGKLNFFIVFDSLSGPITNAHFHKGPMGVAGPVVQGILSFASGNVITGSVDPTPWLNALLTDSIYVNIHTAAFPGGEIRGQLHVMPYLFFDARMDGAQEVPAVNTNARGLTVLQLNYNMDSLRYDVMTVGLSGPMTNGHLHRGPVGVSGPVVVPFTGFQGNRVSGIANISALPDSVKRMLWEGGLYSNIHTAANTAGEIRGQVYRTLREGYTYTITGSQETPPVNTFAYGSGTVSIDRDQTNAHYMAVVTGLTPSAAHFHVGPPGIPGPVIYDLVPTLSNNGAFGYWMDTMTTGAFSAARSSQFRHDSVYINFHTAANPSGEVRGNVSRALCLPFNIPVGVRTQGNNVPTVHIYPNPAGEAATMELTLTAPLTGGISLTDMAGRELWSTDIRLPAGTAKVSLPLKGLSAGLYFVRLSGAGHPLTWKVVKQ